MTTTISTEQIISAEALLRDRLTGLRATFEEEERVRITQRDRIREHAVELGDDHGQDYKVGVDEILTSMGMERSDLWVTAYVTIRWEQVVQNADAHRLRIAERGVTGGYTEWRPAYSSMGGLLGHPVVAFTTQQTYQVEVEDTSIPSGLDCYCDVIAKIVTDPADLKAQHAEPHIPDGARLVATTYAGCCGDECDVRNRAVQAIFA